MIGCEQWCLRAALASLQKATARCHPGAFMRWLDLRIPPPIVAAFFAAAMWAVAGSGPQFQIDPPARYGVAGILLAAGFAFDLLGLAAFRAAHTTINPLKPQRSSSLVTGGIYRVTRNPMYVGLALLLLAWAVYLSSLLPLAGPLIFVLYVTRFQIQPEEQALKKIFGEEFSRYAAGVRRWL
jgi:protein-S-isoprenylcysteine O-methyltransferase Ste14